MTTVVNRSMSRVLLCLVQVLSDWFIIVECNRDLESSTHGCYDTDAEVVHDHLCCIVAMPNLHNLLLLIRLHHAQEPFTYSKGLIPGDTDCLFYLV